MPRERLDAMIQQRIISMKMLPHFSLLKHEATRIIEVHSQDVLKNAVSSTLAWLAALGRAGQPFFAGSREEDCLKFSLREQV
ncbi:MAG: hypothetical protein GX882_09455 [Methanomicrobiales archaeon]|nr:hypothetical protein [Methanomicrobiales archaeon]